MNIVIFGAPGAGKGTQSKFIVEKYNLFQLSTGDLLRNEIKNKTVIGLNIASLVNAGSLVSDDIVSNLIKKIVSNKDYKNNIIFDGYPRNIAQAQNLNLILKENSQKIDLVLRLSVKLETIKKRISGRTVCSMCGKIYNEFFNPAPVASECCSSKYLQKRGDDTADIAIKRFETYEEKIQPVFDFYKNMNLLKEVNGESKIDQISNEISQIISRIEAWL